MLLFFNMADLKREYVVPLRRKTRLAPRWRRSKKAVTVLKEFIQKHMKTENVVVCKELNEFIWADGGKNPPGKVSVVAIRTNVNGVESTVVNLLESGVDNQIGTYAKTPVAAPVKEAKATEVKTEEVKEEKKEEVKSEEVKNG